jgi:hypothetical protein
MPPKWNTAPLTEINNNTKRMLFRGGILLISLVVTQATTPSSRKPEVEQISQTMYSGGRAPSSGFSDWPAQQKTTKKKVGRYKSSSTVPNYKLPLLMMIATYNRN